MTTDSSPSSGTSQASGSAPRYDPLCDKLINLEPELRVAGIKTVRIRRCRSLLARVGDTSAQQRITLLNVGCGGCRDAGCGTPGVFFSRLKGVG